MKTQKKPTTPEVKTIGIFDISADAATQMRVDMDDDQVANCEEAYRAKAAIPPIDVFEGDGTYYIGDGWHRYHGARRAGLKNIAANVWPGGRPAAIKHALGANATHGLRRSNSDKRKAVRVALGEFPDLSNRAIAEMCKVSDPFVSKLRPEVLTVSTSRIGQDGKTYPVKPPAEPVQLDFMEIFLDDVEAGLDPLKTALAQPYWLDARVPTDARLAAIRKAREGIRMIDREYAEREYALKTALDAESK
jgi:uncharacterized ParB-like nuclease family protein